MLEGSVAQVIAAEAGWTVAEGDSLLMLRDLPADCFELLIADAPYSSGGAFRGDRARPTAEKYVKTAAIPTAPEDFEGDTRDQRSFTLWVSYWCAEALRAAKDGAVAVLFTDWRQLAATQDAFQVGGWVFRGIAAWDKTEGSRPRAGGLRSQCEYMVWGTKGGLIERPVYVHGCFRVQTAKDKLHQAVKPDVILSELVKLCPPGGLVLDPFNGSGSTGIAATRAGLRYVGFEISPYWAELSRERIRADLAGSTLRDAQQGQAALFGT